MNDSLTTDMSEVFDKLFKDLVNGPFDPENHYGIQQPDRLVAILDKLAFCEVELQISVLNRLLHCVPATLRNASRSHQHALLPLLHLTLQPWDQRVKALLHSLVVHVGRYFISLEELKRIFLVIAPSGASGVLDKDHGVPFMNLLREMANRFRPDACFDFNGGSSAMQLPVLSSWPNRQGYSIAAWLALEKDNSSRRQYLFSFHSQGGDAVEAFFVYHRLHVVTIKNRGRPSERIIQFNFEPSKWYFLTISHNHNRLMSSELTICVNGAQVGSPSALKYPRAGQSYIAAFVGCNASKVTPPGTQATVPPPLTNSGFFGQLGGFHIFDVALTDVQSHELFVLGPNATQCDTAYKIPAAGHSRFPLALPSLFSREEKSHLILSYHPRAIQGRIALNNIREGQNDGHAKLQGDIAIMHMPALETQLESIGGPKMLFPLYASLCHELQSPELASSLASSLIAVTHELLRQSPILQGGLDDLGGFEIIGHHLRHASAMYFTPAFVNAIVTMSRDLFVGPLVDSFYEHILFDYNIWLRTDDHVIHALAAAQQDKLLSQPHYFRETLGIRFFLDSLRTLQDYANQDNTAPGNAPVNVDSIQTLQTTIRRSISILLKEANSSHPVTKEEVSSLLNFIQECTDAQLVADVFVIMYDLLADATISPSLFHRILDVGGSAAFIHMLHHDVLFVRITSLKAMGKFLQNCPSECSIKFMSTASPSTTVLPAQAASTFASSVLDVLSHHPACQATYLSLLELALEHVSPPSLNMQTLDLSIDVPGIRNPYLLLAVLRLLLHADIDLQLTALQDLTLLLKHSQSNLHMWAEVPGWPQHPFALVVSACKRNAAAQGLKLPVERHDPDDVCDPNLLVYPTCDSETQTLASMVVGLLDTVLTSMITKEGGWAQWNEVLSFAGLADDNSGRLLRSAIVTRQLINRFLVTVSSQNFLSKRQNEPAESPFWSNMLHFLLVAEGHIFLDAPTLAEAEEGTVEFEFVDLSSDSQAQALSSSGLGGGSDDDDNDDDIPEIPHDTPTMAAIPAPVPVARSRRESHVDMESKFIDRLLKLSAWLWNHLLHFDGQESTHGGSSPAKKGFGSFVFDLLPNPFRSSNRQAEVEAFYSLNIFPPVKGLSSRANGLLRVYLRALFRRIELGGTQMDIAQLEEVLFVSSSNYITALACRDNPNLVPVTIRTEWPTEWLAFVFAQLYQIATAPSSTNAVIEDALRLQMNMLLHEHKAMSRMVSNPAPRTLLEKGSLDWTLPTAQTTQFQHLLTESEWKSELLVPAESQRQHLVAQFAKSVSSNRVRGKENAVSRARHALEKEAGRLKDWESGRYQGHLRDAYAELTRRTVASNTRSQLKRNIAMTWDRIWWEMTSEHGIWRPSQNENRCPGPKRHWKIDLAENFSRMHLRLVQSVRSDVITPASWHYKEAEEPDSLPPTPIASAIPGAGEDVTSIDGTVREFIRRGSAGDMFKASPLLDSGVPDSEIEETLDKEEDGDAANQAPISLDLDPEWDVVDSMEDAPMWVPREEDTGVASVVKHGDLVYRTRAALVKPHQVEYGYLELTKHTLFFTIDRKAVSLTKDDEPDVESERTKQLEIQRDANDVSLPLKEIRSIMKRRYLLRDCAFELLTSDSCTQMFHCTADTVVPLLKKLKICAPSLRHADLRSAESQFRRNAVTARWQARELSNFDYLMYLNTLAGRTFNDFSQYPVFPWVIADYESPQLDLSNPKTFRDLSKPMGALNDERLAQFLERYESFSDPDVPPFLYGTHYSNPGSVLYFLVRLEPYTSKHIELQSGKFDVPDRMFHSLGQTYANCAGPDNLSDVKEAIPELYCLPDLYINRNELSMGTKQDGEELGDVALPRWASSAYDLVAKMRAALESDYVSDNLHHWIDLIFGYKQRGTAAVKAHNVFYFLTYAGTVDMDAVEDPIQRKAFELQIASFGQTPIQVTTRPHPARGRFSTPQPSVPLAPSGLAIRNAAAAGPRSSPIVAVALTRGGECLAVTSTLVMNRYKVKRLADEAHAAVRSGGLGGIAANVANAPYELRCNPASGHIVFPFATTTEHMNSEQPFYISKSGKYLYTAGHWDCSVRVSQVTSMKDGKAAKLVQSVNSHQQIATCLQASEDETFLVSGARDCTVRVWTMNERSSSTPLSEHPIHILHGHSSPIHCVAASVDLDLVVSGSAETILHSLAHGRYIRHLEYPVSGSQPITAIVVNRAGIFVTSVRDKTIHQFSVNGFHMRTLPRHEQPVTTMCALGTVGFAAGTPSGQVLIYDMRAAVIQCNVRVVPGCVTSIDWDEELGVFVVGLRSGSVVLFPFYSPIVDESSPRRLLAQDIV